VASVAGCKVHSFHKFTERAAYTKENFQIKKEEENPNWTCLSAPMNKDGDTIEESNYVPKSLGLATLGKKGLSVLGDKDGKDRVSLGSSHETDKTILSNFTISPGLIIPAAINPTEPNLRCRMYRNKYPDVEETVVVLVKRIDVMGVYVNLIEYDDTEGMILLSELSRRRIRSVKKLVSPLSFPPHLKPAKCSLTPLPRPLACPASREIKKYHKRRELFMKERA